MCLLLVVFVLGGCFFILISEAVSVSKFCKDAEYDTSGQEIDFRWYCADTNQYNFTNKVYIEKTWEYK